MAEESSSLTQSLQRSLVELTIAFDATVEAFARALELREGEPLGHTHQVMEVAFGLAKVMRVSLPEQTDIRRGALLHDIGQVTVPESILKKVGPLTDAEWVIMKQHPQCAYDLLSPIAFLHSTIDIPFCHHERWDGCGYPQGLKQEQIPRSARIFAVVDVWDALTSDRPQRKAWTDEQASHYLHEQAGKLFDPQVVNAFLDPETRKRVTRPLNR